MAKSIILFWGEELGGSAVEYSLLIGCIALVVVGVITALGTAVLSRLYNPAVSIF
jgi:Flp pilus assembly pilin Flp